MPVSTKNVVINLNVKVDTSGNIEVFGDSETEVVNIIRAVVKLPTNCLYNITTDDSLIEFIEPTSDLSTIVGRLRQSGNKSYVSLLPSFAYYFQKILEGNFDCSGASPFNDVIKYANNPDYTTQADFGRLLLSVYAHYLFGHLAATVAITNDDSIIKSTLSFNSSNLYKYSSIADIPSFYNEDGTINSVWTNVSSNDINLALRMIAAIIINADPTYIAKKVIGQDASRAMDVDNNELSPPVYQPLIFRAGDVIYLQITIIDPTIVISNGQQVSSSDLTTPFSNRVTNSTKYSLEITLEDTNTPAPSPAPAPSVPAPNIQTLQNSTFSFNNKSAITPINVASYNTGGTATSYSIESGSLPSGLGLNTSSGIISGTVTSSGEYTTTIKAVNSTSQSLATFTFDIAMVAPNFTNVNIQIIKNVDINDNLNNYNLGDLATSFNISGNLGAGPVFDEATGAITGLRNATGVLTYSITATNSVGTFSGTITLTCVETAPILSLNSNNSYNVQRAVAIASPYIIINNAGSFITSVSSSPLLPGLSLTNNNSSIRILGTPNTYYDTPQTYVITATNSIGSTNINLTLTWIARAPVIAYANKNSFTNTSLSITPTNTGEPGTYSISPALPSGLSIDSVTGVVSGTTPNIPLTTTYTVSCTNSGGTGTANLELRIYNSLVPNITYPKALYGYSYDDSVSIIPTNLNNTGGYTNSYSISPALPSGLSINGQTGEIYGTYSQELSQQYTVTATNIYTTIANLGMTTSTGTSTFNVTISFAALMPIYGKWLDASGDETEISLTADNNGNIYVTGSTGNPLTDLASNFSTNTQVVNTNTSGTDVYLTQFNPTTLSTYGQWSDVSGYSERTTYVVSNDTHLYNVYVTNAYDTTNKIILSRYSLPNNTLTTSDALLPNINKILFDASGAHSFIINEVVISGNYICVLARSFTGSFGTMNLNYGDVSGTNVINSTSVTCNGQRQSTTGFVFMFNTSLQYLGGFSIRLRNTTSNSGQIISSASFNSDNNRLMVVGHINGSSSVSLSINGVAPPASSAFHGFSVVFDLTATPFMSTPIKVNWITNSIDTNSISITSTIYGFCNYSDASGSLNGNVFYIAGNTNKSTITGFTNQPGTNAFIAMYDESGNYLKNIKIDSVGNESNFKLVQDASNNIYMVGALTNVLSSTYNDVFYNTTPSPPFATAITMLMSLSSSMVPRWGYWFDTNTAATNIKLTAIYIKNNKLYVAGNTAVDTVRPEINTILGTKPNTGYGTFFLVYNL
jgi:hypothetical protein